MAPKTAKRLRWIGRILFVSSLVAFVIGFCAMAATSETMRWTQSLPPVLAYCCAFLWWIPGVTGVALLFASRPPA